MRQGCFSVLLLAGCLAAVQPIAGRSETSPPEHGPNRLSTYTTLSAQYFALRHGESVPSAEARICSSLEAGVDPANGLTARGRAEVADRAREWFARHRAGIATAAIEGRLVIVTSPFSRTRESAQVFAEVLDEMLQLEDAPSLVSSIAVEPDLRERSFGDLEGQRPSGPLYRQVWAVDATDSSHERWGVESAEAVQARTTAVIDRLERRSRDGGGALYVLVAHGDTLKILQTGFVRASASSHVDPAVVRPFETAEIRLLELR
jgi:broad specificity phosphatase PhoE